MRTFILFSSLIAFVAAYDLLSDEVRREIGLYVAKVVTNLIISILVYRRDQPKGDNMEGWT